jgi:two-component system cell cycle response regulator
MRQKTDQLPGFSLVPGSLFAAADRAPAPRGRSLFLKVCRILADDYPGNGKGQKGCGADPINGLRMPTRAEGSDGEPLTGERIRMKTVLVVEDNPLNLKLVRSLLQLGGFHVIEAQSAEIGIQKASQFKPDLVLMDIQLPGMDGLSAVRHLRTDPCLQQMPIVALTSYAMTRDKERAMAAGCQGFITKPIDTRTFLKTVAGFMPPSGSQTPPSAKRCTSRILIVDDDPKILVLLEAILKQDDVEVIQAEGGQEAWTKVAESHPDLILTDVMMPIVNGYELTRRLKNDPDTRHIPVILLTALDAAEDKAKGLEAGADEFLNKPVSSQELKARVRSLIQLKRLKEQFQTRKRSCDTITPSKEPSAAGPPDPSRQTVFLVEDDEKDASLIQHYLEDQPYQIHVFQNGEEALRAASEIGVDLIILDIFLPGLSGFDICHCLKKSARTRNIQIIVTTCLKDIDSRIRGIELGADDYLVKPINRFELKARIHALLRKKSYIDSMHLQLESALDAAITDKLTGLYNQAYLKHFLQHEIVRSVRQNHALSLIMLDVDNFKKFNDTHGHLSGDEVLMTIGKLIQENIREADLAARYGGEEFVIVVPYGGAPEAKHIAERIRASIEKEYACDENRRADKQVTVSLGIACLSADITTAESLIEKADKALYQAKSCGKNCWQLSGPLPHAATGS